MSGAVQVSELGVAEMQAQEAVGGKRPVPGRPQEALPWLPCRLTLEVPVLHFTVRSLLELQPEVVLETSCHQSMDVPMRVNGVLMAWTEFEVVGERLAARITDLA